MLLVHGAGRVHHRKLSFSGLPYDQIAFQVLASQIQRTRSIESPIGRAFESTSHTQRFENDRSGSPPNFDIVHDIHTYRFLTQTIHVAFGISRGGGP
jgi:hypothetical protein